MLRKVLAIGKQAFAIFIRERAETRGAALAFYTATALAPMLVIAISIAGLYFGREAASGALFGQFRSLFGVEAAEFLQKTIASSWTGEGEIAANLMSIITLLLGASGVFLELEDALNAMWGVKMEAGIWTMARARAASLGLVIALGFVLMVSLVIDAGLKAMMASFPFGAVILVFANIGVSVALMTGLFAAIFKYLPARRIAWRDVVPGATVTAFLFESGRFLIGWYLGRGETTSALGAGGALLSLLFWVYYSAQIFLFGAALTVVQAGEIRKNSSRLGSRR
jgi:membrane protein